MFMEVKDLWLQPILNVNKEGKGSNLLASIEWTRESKFKKVIFTMKSKNAVNFFNLSVNNL